MHSDTVRRACSRSGASTAASPAWTPPAAMCKALGEAAEELYK